MEETLQGALDFRALVGASQPSSSAPLADTPFPGSHGGSRFQVTQADAVEWLNTLPPESVDLIITDPPYESLEKHRAIGTTTRLKHSKASSNDWFRIFPNARFPELFAAVYRVLKRHTHFYLFCDQETMFVVKPIAESAGFRFWKPLVWDKCIAPDTPVWTTGGVVRADQLEPGDRVATPDGRDVAILATRTTRSPVVRLALSDGTSIVCSPNHRLAASDGQVVEAGTLGRGSTLSVAQLPLSNVPSSVPRDRLSEEEPFRLDYARGKTIGLYAAEGNRNDLSDRSKSFSAFVGGHGAASKHLTKRALQAPLEFLRGLFDGLIEAAGHRPHDEQAETFTTASLDLACFVLRFARQLGWHATLRRFESTPRGGWRVRLEPGRQQEPLSVVSIETGGETELIDVAIDDPAQLYVLGNGAVSHNCKIGMGYHYRARYEFILFFEKGKRKLNDLGIPDVISHPRILNGYPTEKPMEVSRVLVTQSSSPNDLVVDPFMGSGSVGAAALSSGRRFQGADIAETALGISTERLQLLAAGK